MSARLRSAAWIAGYTATLGALVACAVFAPWWVTAGVLAVGAAVALRWVVRRVPLGGP